jgi:hypothetical protein
LKNYKKQDKYEKINDIYSVTTLSGVSRNIYAVPSRLLNGVAVWCFNRDLSLDQRWAVLWSDVNWFWIIASEADIRAVHPYEWRIQRDGWRPWARVWLGC